MNKKSVQMNLLHYQIPTTSEHFCQDLKWRKSVKVNIQLWVGLPTVQDECDCRSIWGDCCRAKLLPRSGKNSLRTRFYVCYTHHSPTLPLLGEDLHSKNFECAPLLLGPIFLILCGFWKTWPNNRLALLFVVRAPPLPPGTPGSAPVYRLAGSATDNDCFVYVLF